MQSINPASGQIIRDYPDMSLAEATRGADQVATASAAWRSRSFDERAGCLRKAAAVLRDQRRSLAELMACEMGKPVAEGGGEIDKCASVCDYYAEHGAQFLAPEVVVTEAANSYVAFEPLGAVLAIMPWNFPFWQVFRFAAPALMAGNGAVLKHASNVPGCAEAIERVLGSAEFPPQLLRGVRIGGADAAHLIEHPSISAVSFTGSTAAGRSVAARAGQALKKCVLELGGSDAYVVLADADLDRAVATCVKSRLINGGQSCIAAKRFIVVKQRLAAFTEGMIEGMRNQRQGDPLDPNTTLGPLARRELRDALHRQVERSVAAGARVLLGGKRPEGPGAWYPATVLGDVKPGMPAYDEELFGPVAAIIAADDESAALRIANDTRFGLGAAVFTNDVEKGEYIAAKVLQAGACFVNDYVRSDPRLPFGGIKDSGYGRELGAFGIREFTNTKTVYVS